MINYGAVYPQCILVFIITLLYGVIQPLILFFGTIYFGMSYMVYKYKLLFGELSEVANNLFNRNYQFSTAHTNLLAKRGRLLSSA